MNLSIIDGDALIHSGTKASFSKDANYHGFPTGGLYRLLRELSSRRKNGDHVIVCFDSKTNRRELLPEYKGTRGKNPSVYLQKDTIIPMLRKIGIDVLQRYGYEADDLIYHACRQNYDSFEQINIIGNDFDLLYTLDSDVKVCYRSSNGKSPDIHAGNYNVVINGAVQRFKCKIPFGAISAYKVFNGDVSDSIPAITEDTELNIKLLAAACKLSMVRNDTALPIKLVEKAEILEVVKHSFFNILDREVLAKRINVVYPIDIEPDYCLAKMSEINNEALSDCYTLFGMRKCAAFDKITCRDPNAEEIKFLEEKAKLLKSSAIAVDMDLPLKPTAIFSSSSVESEGDVCSDYF